MTNAPDDASTKLLDLVFFTGFALLACHELDAVAQHEWRLLPVLSGMRDTAGYTAFVLLHIPLFALLMWWTASTEPRTRLRAQLLLDAFFVIHAVLHFALRHQPEYTFHSWLSELCIFGAGLVGLVHGLLWLRKSASSDASPQDRPATH